MVAIRLKSLRLMRSFSPLFDLINVCWKEMKTGVLIIQRKYFFCFLNFVFSLSLAFVSFYFYLNFLNIKMIARQWLYLSVKPHISIILKAAITLVIRIIFQMMFNICVYAILKSCIMGFCLQCATIQQIETKVKNETKWLNIESHNNNNELWTRNNNINKQ